MKALDNRFYVKFMQLEIGLFAAHKIATTKVAGGAISTDQPPKLIRLISDQKLDWQ